MGPAFALRQPGPCLEADVSSVIHFKNSPAAKAIAKHCPLLTSLTIGDWGNIGEGGAKQASVPIWFLSSWQWNWG